MADVLSDVVATMRRNAIFASVPDSRLAQFAQQAKRITRGEIVVGLGSRRQSLLLVHSGWLAQRVTHHMGGELVLSILGRSDCLGIPELILSIPAEAETVAGADSVLVSIPWRDVTQLWPVMPEFRTGIERAMAAELVQRRSRLITFAFSTLEGRIAAFLLETEKVAQRTPGFRLTQGLIADAVGASRPRVNRCLKDLERRGVVALHNGSMPEIRSHNALVSLL